MIQVSDALVSAIREEILMRMGINLITKECSISQTGVYSILESEAVQEELKKLIARENRNPSLDEALNSGDGSYKP